jgi:hypothetical protein
MDHMSVSETYQRFWNAVALASAGRLAPAESEMPPPWEAWTLLALYRHRRRQLWVGEIVETLGTTRERVSGFGNLALPEKQSGVVPGNSDWEFYFHGIGCCLTHRQTGEAIDVDFHGGSAEHISVFFYEQFLKSLRSPAGVEERVLRLHPKAEAMSLSFDALVEAGAMTKQMHQPARISEEALEHDEAALRFCDLWNAGKNRTELAAAIGDWLYVGEENSSAQSRAQAQQINEARKQRLLAIYRSAEHPSTALEALSDLEIEELPELVIEVLRGPICGTTSSAIKIVEAKPALADWWPEVYATMKRTNPGGIPDAYIWEKCATLLLVRGYRRPEIAADLASAGERNSSGAALLALEFAPELARGLLARALRSYVPAERHRAAATLAVIDRPWCHAELMAVLDGSREQLATVDCRAALAESRFESVRAAARKWEEENPHERDPGKFISADEGMLRHTPQFVQWEMEQIRERVMKAVAKTSALD